MDVCLYLPALMTTDTSWSMDGVGADLADGTWLGAVIVVDNHGPAFQDQSLSTEAIHWPKHVIGNQGTPQHSYIDADAVVCYFGTVLSLHGH
jgi:hypothetical protein